MVKTPYETHGDKFLAIVQAVKTWRHYSKSCKHEILIFADHNNLHRFMK